MPSHRLKINLEIDVVRSPRVVQLEGIFDVPEAKKRTLDLEMDVDLNWDWKIGLISGPSGAGKTSVARALFPERMIDGYDWKRGRALVDSFPDSRGIREITEALSSVGFSSPPSWTKPFEVLSNGEKFRATLARALLDERDLIVFDEFTSLVDRTVGKIGAHSVAKAIRRKEGKRFVAVTCHEDVEEWLCPDWVLRPHLLTLERGRHRRRPDVELEIRRIGVEEWPAFAPHHYLSGSLNRSSKCFGAFYENRLVAFVAWLPFVGRMKGKGRRVHRVVCLPDFQGLGIGKVLVGSNRRNERGARISFFSADFTSRRDRESN